jgi:hypothetical protein
VPILAPVHLSLREHRTRVGDAHEANAERAEGGDRAQKHVERNAAKHDVVGREDLGRVDEELVGRIEDRRRRDRKAARGLARRVQQPVGGSHCLIVCSYESGDDARKI